MFGMIAVTGIKLYKNTEMNRRDMFIIALSLGSGMAVVVRPELLSNLPESLKTIFSSGITTGSITAIILYLILPKLS